MQLLFQDYRHIRRTIEKGGKKKIMSGKVIFAEKNNENELRKILLNYGMDISGGIEEHLVVIEGQEILGGLKLVEFSERNFFLEVIGVKSENIGQGIGGNLLGGIVKNPWKCCKNPVSVENMELDFQITVVGRGGAEGFYKRYGFEACGFEEMPEPWREQCDDCPEKEECGPVPMIYKRR